MIHTRLLQFCLGGERRYMLKLDFEQINVLLLRRRLMRHALYVNRSRTEAPKTRFVMRPLLSSSLRHLARTNIALALNPALRTSVRLPRLPSFPIQRNFTSSAFRSRNPQYLRFNVDPEKPFDWKRWDTATKVTAGVVVLGVGYYLVQYVCDVPQSHSSLLLTSL